MRSPGRFVLVLGGILVLVVLLAGAPGRGNDEPLDPDGTGPDGARAMVLLLRELGAEVEVRGAAPGADVDHAILLADRLGERGRDDLLEWVDDGGTLVVADPSSVLTPPVADPLAGFGLVETTFEADQCDIADLAGAETLSLEAAVRYEVAPGAASCFGDGSTAFVVQTPVGEGRVVAVGGAEPFTNAGLAREDAAVLVASVLAPEPTSARVTFVDPARAVPGDGDDTLGDLIPDRVVLAVLQLGIAFLAYVWFRARRVGRPVAEPAPTPLAGSELVAAVGDLRQQERAPERAAALLRDDLRRTLARRLGLPPNATVDDLVAAAESAGADPGEVRAALAGPGVDDDEELVQLAREIDRTRREVLHEQH